VKKITVGHINKVMLEVYGSSVQSQQSEGVPLQQKLLLCTLLLAVKQGKFKEVTLGKVLFFYSNSCEQIVRAYGSKPKLHLCGLA
jgi:cell division control protein 6